jgi:hypothetical protein
VTNNLMGRFRFLIGFAFSVWTLIYSDMLRMHRHHLEGPGTNRMIAG